MLASIPQNQFPFAIGVMEASSADIKRNGLKGKGLKLLHHYPDMLWALGNKSVPDPSFTPTRVFPQVLSCLQVMAIMHRSLAHPHKLIAVCRLHPITQCNQIQPQSQLPKQQLMLLQPKSMGCTSPATRPLLTQQHPLLHLHLQHLMCQMMVHLSQLHLTTWTALLRAC